MPFHRTTIVDSQSTIVNKRQGRLGFTLVEILITIAILGVLSSFTAFSLVGHQKKARDAQRKSDLAQVKRALQSAKNDCKSAAYYPRAGTTAVEKTNFTDLTTYLKTQKYIDTTIKDPKDNATYFYRLAQGADSGASLCASASGTEFFIIRTELEVTNDPDKTSSYDRCSSTVSSVTYTAPDPAPTSGDNFYYVCSD